MKTKYKFKPSEGIKMISSIILILCICSVYFIALGKLLNKYIGPYLPEGAQGEVFLAIIGHLLILKLGLPIYLALKWFYIE